MARAKFNFSQGYQELEKIVSDFESRELDLEKDLPQFKRGMELVQKLKERLAEIDNEVVAIEHQFGEALEEADEN